MTYNAALIEVFKYGYGSIIKDNDVITIISPSSYPTGFNIFQCECDHSGNNYGVTLGDRRQQESKMVNEILKLIKGEIQFLELESSARITFNLQKYLYYNNRGLESLLSGACSSGKLKYDVVLKLCNLEEDFK